VGSVFALFLDLARLAARLIRPGGMTRVVAEHLILRQRLILLQRKRKRAPRLLTFDRMVFAISSLFIRSNRLPALEAALWNHTTLTVSTPTPIPFPPLSMRPVGEARVGVQARQRSSGQAELKTKIRFDLNRDRRLLERD
jgi:hypothetical protein